MHSVTGCLNVIRNVSRANTLLMLTGMAHSDWRLNARDVADHGISRSRPTTSTQLKMRVPTIDQMNISLESRPTAIRQFGKSTNCYSSVWKIDQLLFVYVAVRFFKPRRVFKHLLGRFSFGGSCISRGNHRTSESYR